MGLILCPLPWLFASPEPVIALCAIYVGLLCARRYLSAIGNHVSPVIDGVGRDSVGEFLFPVAVAVLFVLARGDRAAYLAPLLVLTLADAAAAVIGRRYGLCRFPTPGGRKSLEGSLAFAAVAFASTHLTLLLVAGAGRIESVLIALVVAIALTAVEALATGGWDNFFVPLAAWGLLRFCPTLTTAQTALLAAAASAAALAAVLLYAIVAGPIDHPRVETSPPRHARGRWAEEG
jgi:phytol kinase